MNPNNRSFGLDFARAVAISLVLLAHFVRNAEYFGFWGVEIFFGLSGFLIGQILWRNYERASTWSVKHVFNFWSRRWWRTLPNYYLFVIVSLFFHQFYYHKIPGLYAFSKYLWFGQDLLVRDRQFYGVSWSLCIEEWLYLLFPIILFLYSKIFNKKSLPFILTLLTIMIGCALVRMYILQTDQADFVRSITLGRIDAIAYGIAIAYFFIIIPSTSIKKLIACIIGVIFILSPVIIGYLTKQSMHALEQNVFLLVIVPLGASLTLPLLSTWQSAKWKIKILATGVEKLSLWSYSIYLCHIPILFTTYALMGHLRDHTLGNILSKVIGLAIAVAVSAFLFKYFEQPFTHKRPRELKS